MKIDKSIKYLEKQIENPKDGLPEKIFLFASRIIPLVNVDLLIKDDIGRTLLSWRDDEYSGKGWHIPGGVIRFKETLEERIHKVAELEIGTQVKFDPIPIAISQIILKKDTRGHAISFLYKCSLTSRDIPKNEGLKETNVGYLKWHNSCPDNLIKVHEVYRKFI